MVRALGLDGVSFHTLRHTFASWWVQNGGDIYELQRILGHSNISLTMRYAHLAPDFTSRAASQIDAFLAPSQGAVQALKCGQMTGKAQAGNDEALQVVEKKEVGR